MPGDAECDTVVLEPMTRQEKYRQFVRSGDKRRSKAERGFCRKPIVYTEVGDGIGVLTINSFWGKRWSHFMGFRQRLELQTAAAAGYAPDRPG